MKLPKAVRDAMARLNSMPFRVSDDPIPAELTRAFYAGALFGAKLAWYPPFGASLTEIRAEIRRMEKEAGEK